MLEWIAGCESGNGTPGSGRQFFDDGRVVLNVNRTGSADVEKRQINLAFHGATPEPKPLKLDWRLGEYICITLLEGTASSTASKTSTQRTCTANAESPSRSRI